MRDGHRALGVRRRAGRASTGWRARWASARCACSAGAAGSARCRWPAPGPRSATSRLRPRRRSWRSTARGRRGKARDRQRASGSCRRCAAGLGGARQPPAAIAAEATALLADPELIRPSRPDIGLVERFVERACVPKVGTTVERVDEPGRAARPPCAATSRPTACPSPSRCSRRPSCSAWTGRGSRHTRAWRRTSRSASASPAGASPRPARSCSTPAPRCRSCRPSCRCTTSWRCGPTPSCPGSRTTRALAGPAPRNAVLITGASGTTDIEGSYVRGAHGPGYLHVVLLEAG